MSFKIAMLGLPGAGKGTQGPKLANYLSDVSENEVPYWSMGDLLYDERGDDLFDPELQATEQAIAEVENIDEEYDTFRDYLEAGHYGDPDFVRQVLVDELGTREAYVLDGYPRDGDQAVDMETKVGGLDMILYLEADEEVLNRRITDRLIDPETRTPYRKGHNMPEDEEVRKRLVPKEGDSAEATAKRIRDQREKQNAVLEFYGNTDVSIEAIDANGDINDVWSNIESVINTYMETDTQ